MEGRLHKDFKKNLGRYEGEREKKSEEREDSMNQGSKNIWGRGRSRTVMRQEKISNRRRKVEGEDEQRKVVKHEKGK